MITRKRKTFLLGLLGAATAAGMVLGATGVISSTVGEPVEVSAADSDIQLAELTSVSSINPDGIYILGAYVDQTFYGYSSGISSWGECSTDSNSWAIWSLEAVNSSNNSFSAINDSDYYLTVPTSKWSLSLSKTTIYLDNGKICNQNGKYSIQYNHNGGNGGLRSYDKISSDRPLVGFYELVTNNVTGIEVTGEFNTSFHETDSLSLDGMVVTAKYDDDTEKELSSSEYTISPELGTVLDPSIDKVTVSYTYVGKTVTADIAIDVTPRAITGITVSSLPNKTEYVVGQSLDTTGLVVEAVYDYGDPADVTDDCVVEEVELTEAGNKTISVSYGEFSTSFEITVVDRAIEKLSLTEKTTSFAKGQKFTLGPAAKLVAIWNDGTEDEITLDTEGVSVEMLDSSDSELGTGKKIGSSYALTLEDNGKYISITYFGVKANKYQISVADRLDATRGFFKEVVKDGDLKVGDYILLAYNENVMGQQNGTYRNRVSLDTTPNGKITIDNDGDYQIVKLEEGSQSGSFALRVGNEYLEYHESGNDVYTESKTDAESLEAMSWYLNFDADTNTFEIQNVGYTDRSLQYNSSSPRFACYTSNQKDPSIYKFVDVESIREFVDTYMHMSDYNDNENKCYGVDGYYAKAKEALVKLTDEQIELFKTDSEFEAARTRYLAWAAANGDNSPYSGEYVSPALSIRNSDDLMDIAIISALAVAGIAAAGAFVFLRRKKEA